MKKGLIIMAAALLACSLCACQATPEAPVVINKGNGELEQAIAATNAPTQDYTADEYWKESFTSKDGKVKIAVDAGVTLPDTDNFPVVKAVPTHFSEEEVKRIAGVLFGGQEVYINDNNKNKESIMQEIIECKEELALEKDMLDDEGINEEYIKRSIADLEKYIKGLEAEYSNMSDDSQLHAADYKYELKDTGMYVINIMTKGASPAKLTSLYDKSEKSCALGYQNSGDKVYSAGSILGAEDELQLTMTKAEAQALVEKALTDMGVDNMSVTQVYSGRGTTRQQAEQERADAENAVQNNTDMSVPTTDSSSDACYVFCLTRNICGLNATYISDYDGKQSFGVDGETYQQPWDPEVIEVFINNSGIISFEWTSPAKTDEVLNENIALKSFDEIKEVGKNLLAIKFSEKDEKTKRNISITNVSLGMMRIAKENNASEYMYIPVWDFLGHYEGSKSELSFLTINAVDGTIIDRALGY